MIMGLKSSLLKPGAAFLLLLSFTACGGSGSNASRTPSPAPASTPTVVSFTPSDLSTNAPLNGSASASFSEAMVPNTLTGTTFTLTTSGASAVPVAGTVNYANSRADFWPTALLTANSQYTATITTGAKSASGVALAAQRSWSFTTGTTVAPGLPVNLRTAGNYVILAQTAITTVPNSVITGDMGVSPIASGAITGFSLIPDATRLFSTSLQVTGKVYAADYAVPTPSNLTTAVGDMQLAYTDAAGRTPAVIGLGAGDISGQNLAPGVYKWTTALLISTNVTLTGTGTATDVWIFQIAQDLNMISGVSITLAGGALPKNIFWQVAGKVNLGTNAHCEGIVLTQTAVTLRTGASINGRLLAQTAVNIDASTIVAPAP